MSRTPLSSGSPRRRGPYRPQLEALEDRLPPGGLHGAGHDRDEPDLARLAGMAASSHAATRAASPAAAAAAGSHGAVSTTNPVVDFATRSTVFGESTVMRTANGVTAHLMASGLTPGVYTFWMRVDAPGAPPAAGRLAGHVVGESGIANFSGHVNVGDIVGNPSIPGLEGTLQDPRHATITLVVRSHGPAEPGRIHEQTHTFEPDVAFNFLLSIHAPPPGP